MTSASPSDIKGLADALADLLDQAIALRELEAIS